MGKECVPVAIDVPRLNRRSKCGYFSPCKQGRGFARNGVQTLECNNKDILNRMQRHPRTQSIMGERARLCSESSLLSELSFSHQHVCDGINKEESTCLKSCLRFEDNGECLLIS